MLFGEPCYTLISKTGLLTWLCRNGSPILVTLVSFWHFAIVRKQVLTPSIAFTSISGESLLIFLVPKARRS